MPHGLENWVSAAQCKFPCQPWTWSWVYILRIAAASRCIYTPVSAIFCPTATFYDLLWAPFLFPCFPLWYSDVKTELRLSNLESDIRAGGGYYLWVDSDWIGSRGSNTPKWQLGGNPGPIYLTRRGLKRLGPQQWPSVGGCHDEMHRSRAGGESREENKRTAWLASLFGDHVSFVRRKET